MNNLKLNLNIRQLKLFRGFMPLKNLQLQNVLLMLAHRKKKLFFGVAARLHYCRKKYMRSAVMLLLCFCSSMNFVLFGQNNLSCTHEKNCVCLPLPLPTEVLYRLLMLVPCLFPMRSPSASLGLYSLLAVHRWQQW